MGTETENEETANCLGTEGGGEKIRVSIGNGHLGRESEAGRAASERVAPSNLAEGPITPLRQAQQAGGGDERGLGVEGGGGT